MRSCLCKKCKASFPCMPPHRRIVPLCAQPSQHMARLAKPSWAKPAQSQSVSQAGKPKLSMYCQAALNMYIINYGREEPFWHQPLLSSGVVALFAAVIPPLASQLEATCTALTHGRRPRQAGGGGCVRAVHHRGGCLRWCG